MTWIMRLFSLTLKLYPRSFQDRFGSEMEEVFQAGLVEALSQGVWVGFILRELLRLPADLVGVYVWSMRAEKEKQLAAASAGGGGTINMTMTGEGWGESFLAGLPHLLIGFSVIAFEFINVGKGATQTGFRDLLIIALSLVMLAALFYGIFRGWKPWSASWIIYIFLLTISLLIQAANQLTSVITGNNQWVDEVQVFVIPLILAYLLYKIACRDRLRGLLAAVPLTVIIWAFFLEFVPEMQKSLAYSWIFLLAFVATVMMLRTRRFLAALELALIVPILGGFPFVYLGVYMGGTLPFSEPGPGLQEVFRQYLPFLAMALATVLGPQLAVKLRIVGYNHAKAGGKIFYRLTLGGILLGLVFTLTQWAMATSGVRISQAIQHALLFAAIGLYILGFALLIWATIQSKSPSGDYSRLLELAELFIPLIFVPLAIILTIPISTGHELANWLLPLAEIAWVAIAVWVVKD
ncbi:MAG: hypothetical protein WAV05_13535 [Anaerolineales bacterium]